MNNDYSPYLSDPGCDGVRMNDIMDLEIAAPWLLRPRRLPRAVAQLRCLATRTGGLMFSWQRSPASEQIDGYLIERTRAGGAYEEIARTRNEAFFLRPVSFNDGWFYRVSAFNERGRGAANRVIFYLRRRRKPILQLVPVRFGLRVNICEFTRSRIGSSHLKAK